MNAILQVKKKVVGATTRPISLESSSAGLATKLDEVDFSPTFISAYVSPHVDIDQIARVLSRRFPGVPMMICSTAGVRLDRSIAPRATAGTAWWCCVSMRR
jgi:hypothetical protein